MTHAHPLSFIALVLPFLVAACAAPQVPMEQPTALIDRLRAMCERAPLTVAHRGASEFYPENTTAAFLAAVAFGAQMVELDVRQTADGRLVVIHDETLDRTTNSAAALGIAGQRVDQVTWAEIQGLDAGAWKDERFATARVPTLGEALDTIQPASITMIEHKAASATAIVDLLRRRHQVRSVLLQSFDWDWLAEVHALEPAITLGVLGEDPITEATYDAIEATGAMLVHWDIDHLTRANVAALHDRGYLVCTYTANTDQQLIDAAATDLDAITTNRPARLLELQAGGTARRPGH